MKRLIWMALLAAGCADSDTGEVDTEPAGCGDPTSHEATITGRVEDASGAGVSGATVILEDRAWNLGDILGTTTSGANGSFTLSASEVIEIENCWGQLNYTLVATEGDREGEKVITNYLFNAVDDGSFAVDLQDFPVTVE